MIYVAAAVAIAVGVLAAVPAFAETKSTNPEWVRRPTPEALLAVWPAEAMRRGLSGRAIITCKISEQGALFGCTVDSETPAKMGFGAAAIALTPQFLMRPATQDGKPVVSQVRLPINFVAPEGPATGSHIPGSDVVPFSRTVISNVRWQAAPSYAEVVATYPKAAATAAIGGRVTLDCDVRPDGALKGCKSIVEEPSGMGFGAAARSLVPYFRAPPTTAEGTPTAGATAHIPIVFAPEMLDPARRITGKIQWARTPTGDVFAAGYPQAAKDAGVRVGRVMMDCQTGPGGKLEACRVAREEPAGLGFAAAALALSPSFYVRPWTAEGLPAIGGQVRVPIRYQIPEAEPAEPNP